VGRVCLSSCSITLIFYKRLVSRLVTSWYDREQEASKMSKRSIYLRLYCGLVLILFVAAGRPVTTGAQNDTDLTVTPSGKVVSGGDEYRKFCAQCHGLSGKGDGPVASELKTPPGDLTQLSKKNNGTFPYQQVYDTISGKNVIKSHGTREMPAYSLELALPRHPGGTVRRSEYQVDLEIKRITDYIKSIQQQ
jgi:mono/diheme cytochrome c family protein